MRSTWTPEADAIILASNDRDELKELLDACISASAIRHRRLRLLSGEVKSPALSDADRLLRQKGLDPDQWTFVSGRASSWDGPTAGGGKQKLNLTEVKVIPRSAEVVSDEEADRFLAELRALAARPAPAPVALAPIVGTGDTAVVLFSDLHIGKKADAAMVGNNFAYSTEIALAYHRVWLDATKASLRIRKPRQIVLGLLADNIEGSMMRDGQGFRIDCTIGRQGRILTDVLVITIAELSEIAPVVVVALAGNHSRIGKKGEGLTEDNVEVLVHYSLVHVFAGNPRVSVHAITTPDFVMEIRGKLVAFTHGDRISGPSEKAHFTYLGLLEDAWGLGRPIDILCSAHWHAFSEYHQQNRTCVCNGGGDGGACDFARNQIMKNTRPEQVLFGLDDGDGIAWREVIALAPVRPARTLLVAEAA